MFYFKDENGKFYKSTIKFRLLTPITREEFLASQILNKDIPEYQELLNDYKTKDLHFYKENENYFALDEKWRYDGFTQITEEEYLEKFKVQKQIDGLKQQLADTDYIANKLSEAQVIYTVTGDNTKLLEVYNKYKDLIVQRDEWRKQIDKLEK